ncbi:MAG: hypothetical protein ACE5MM_09560, partial [Nitrospiraceae bacterium]
RRGFGPGAGPDEEGLYPAYAPSMRSGKRVRYAGLVICRQWPASASNVVFMTLEDETGFVNVVLYGAFQC